MSVGRGLWIAWCIFWAAAWFVAGFFFFPFWLGVPCSLFSILIPLGAQPTPTVLIQQSQLPPPSQQTATWDGQRWISPDGLAWWDGQRWVQR